MKRSGPLRRSTPLSRSSAPIQRKTPLRSGERKGTGSASRRTSDPEWQSARAHVLARDGGCVGYRYGHPHRCWGGLHVHHLRRRSAGGTNEPTNLVTLCASAHQWVHEHPAQAADLGLLHLRGTGNE